jgi:hypothetical protein
MTRRSSATPMSPTKGDNASQHFNDTLRALLVVVNKLYRDHPSLVIIFIFLSLMSFYSLFRAINSNYMYSLIVTFLFMFLSICLYIKDKNSLNSIFSFSLGIFTAFTVAWNGPTFSIFFISFIILLIGIFFIASIRAAATVEERLTTAANSYINDFDTNKKDLQEVKAHVAKQGGLLSIDKIWEAIVFFAYQKVPKHQMITLIDALNYVYTVTKADTESLLILLNNMNHLSHTEAGLAINIAALKLYILKGKSTPSNLVKILNDSLHVAIENNIDFVLFTETILTYLSHGYTQEKIVEKLSATFTSKAG